MLKSASDEKTRIIIMEIAEGYKRIAKGLPKNEIGS
jgi:hypothetical protein